MGFSLAASGNLVHISAVLVCDGNLKGVRSRHLLVSGGQDILAPRLLGLGATVYHLVGVMRDGVRVFDGGKPATEY